MKFECGINCNCSDLECLGNPDLLDDFNAVKSNKDALKQLKSSLESDFSKESIKFYLSGSSKEFYRALRFLLLGSSKYTMPIVGSMDVLGKEETLKRIGVFIA